MPAAIAIKTVVDAVVAQFLDMDALATRFGDSITAYNNDTPQTRNRAEATVELLEPAMLVACVGAGMSTRGGLPCWRYNLVAIVRLEATGDYQTLFSEIVDGIPASGAGLRWLDDSPIPDDLEPPDQVAYNERHDATGVEYWELSFSLTATGG